MSWDIRTKKARNFSVYSRPKVFAVPMQQNNQKPTPKQREHFRYYSCCILISRQTLGNTE